MDKTLRAMATYFRKHDFSPELGADGAARCFDGAARSVLRVERHTPTESDCPLCSSPLNELLGNDFTSDRLARDGWTKRDAIAACEIAADLAA